MYLFNFIKKYFLVIAIFALIGGVSGYFGGKYFGENYVKLKLFTTVSVSDENSSVSEKEKAATFFGETLIGWFQNPSFTNYILQKYNGKNSITAYKQERQNLVIAIKSSSEEGAQNIARDTYSFLNKKIAQLNKNAKSKYSLIDQGYVFQKSFDVKIIYAILFFVLLGFFTTMFFVVRDYLKGVILSENDAKKILGGHLIDYISEDFTKNDYSIISVGIQKLKGLVILGGVGVDIEKFSIGLSQKHSFSGEDMVLIDGDLEKRGLHYEMGLSSRLQNLKGITNLNGENSEIKLLENKKSDDEKAEKEKEKNHNLYLQNTLDENLKFIPAGTGNRVAYDVLDQLSDKVRILIHTHLPKNADMLRFKKGTLILLIKIGVTKIEDLQRIKEAWGGDIKYVIVK
ncbi:hypothetical protein LR002_00170 [Candidatus Gracilibacteria bacterium]|nr:hypothetical protein [Candidatus Gracilibacteria bacterium]